MKRYAVATVKPWNIDAFHRRSPSLLGQWSLIERPEDLTTDRLQALGVRYVFFPHWSWKVPADVLAAVECVCFHMADVPYGRGGSPLQNLIQRGHRDTMLTALRMVDELDAGPVYLKRPLSLSGRAQDIFERMADLAWDMIAEIVALEPVPTPQQGTPVLFTRRKPEDSRLPDMADLDALYDHIRMLDAESYPHAFLDHGSLRLEFSDARRQDGAVTATVTIRPKTAS
ncbi:hypothetical protein [Azospirillum soli]|uniref:hypothetical protein n=1 Tax=Azospirillum soli TaxID=1304799 RepID=UPI001AE7E3E8|nr:hypothetical protein [Azospirillum soli]MBP2316063.1 methionyl-tRNA formyltransferase [Azospirillum soli]